MLNKLINSQDIQIKPDLFQTLILPLLVSHLGFKVTLIAKLRAIVRRLACGLMTGKCRLSVQYSALAIDVLLL